MSAFEHSEKRELANRLFALIDEHHAEDREDERQAELYEATEAAYEAGRTEGYDAGWYQCSVRTSDELNEIATRKSNRTFAAGVEFSSGVVQRIGQSLDKGEAA